jgi:replicative DNA helicase
MAKLIKKRNAPSSDKLSVKFDIPTLNSLIKYTLCDIISSNQLSNLFKFVNKLDINTYNYSPDIQLRLKLIILLGEAVIDNQYKDLDIIKSYISQKNEDAMKLFDELNINKNSISVSECKFITDAIHEKLQCVYVYEVKDSIIESLEKLDNNGFLNSYYPVINELRNQLSNLMVNLQNSGADDEMIRSFNFSDSQFVNLIHKIVERSKKPTSILRTGIRQLNSLLSPGFHSGRMYTIVAGSGKFKSGTLLNIADQIRRYNPQITPIENGIRKTILYLVLEDSIYETVGKLYDMYSDVDDKISEMTTEEVIMLLREKGRFKFTDNEGIDIDLVYRSDLEIRTCDIYPIIRDLENKNKKVICIILDYLKKIESTKDNNGDERLRLSYVSKELKSMAEFLQIPLITAMQLNREGNGILDAAMRDNKQDVANFVGASNIGKLIKVCADIKPFELRGRTRYVA